MKAMCRHLLLTATMLTTLMVARGMESPTRLRHQKVKPQQVMPPSTSKSTQQGCDDGGTFDKQKCFARLAANPNTRTRSCFCDPSWTPCLASNRSGQESESSVPSFPLFSLCLEAREKEATGAAADDKDGSDAVPAHASPGKDALWVQDMLAKLPATTSSSHGAAAVLWTIPSHWRERNNQQKILEAKTEFIDLNRLDLVVDLDSLYQTYCWGHMGISFADANVIYGLDPDGVQDHTNKFRAAQLLGSSIFLVPVTGLSEEKLRFAKSMVLKNLHECNKKETDSEGRKITWVSPGTIMSPEGDPVEEAAIKADNEAWDNDIELLPGSADMNTNCVGYFEHVVGVLFAAVPGLAEDVREMIDDAGRDKMRRHGVLVGHIPAFVNKKNGRDRGAIEIKP